MANPSVKMTEDGVTVDVWVVPGSSRAEVAGAYGDRIKIRVTSPPEGGRANAEVADLLKAAIGKRARLVTGMTSRNKVFEIANTDVDTVRRKLGLDA